MDSQGTSAPSSEGDNNRDTGVTARTPLRLSGPGALEVMQLLTRHGSCKPLELGVMLGLPANFLLSLVPWSDPRHLWTAMLRAVCPINLDMLASVLEDDLVNAHDLAVQVRRWAQKNALPQRVSCDADVDRLVDLLLPLVDSCPYLVWCLGLSEDQIRIIKSDCSQRCVKKELQAVVEEACRIQERSCEDWLAALARSGSDWSLLEKIATHWGVDVPTDCSDWYDYCQQMQDPQNTGRDIVLHDFQQSQADEAIVPLQKVWLLLRSRASLLRLPLALEYVTDYVRCWECGCEMVALLALLHYAVDRKIEGLSGSDLARLKQQDCLEPDCIPSWALQARLPERRSRRLAPSDLPLLVSQEPEQVALEVAALLGVGLHYDVLLADFSHCSPHERALQIWKHIYSRVPLLETGHIAQLFSQCDRPQQIEALTGSQDGAFEPSVALGSICVRFQEFAQLAMAIDQNPMVVAAFMIGRALEQSSLWSAPVNTPPKVRLLNCLAQDSRLLTALHEVL
ncbi:MAG: hypothetical protein OXC07_00700 [Kistimonas sp.]|nr:hypothetical protein [Kistimonas sp.]